MNNKQTNLQTRKLYLYIVLLVIWSMVGAYLLVNYTPTLSLLGIALNIFVIIFSLTELFPYASWVSLVLAVGLFTGAGYSILNINQELLISSGVGAGVFILTAVICTIYAAQVRKVDEKYARLQQVTDSLVIYDRFTALMRWKFAQQSLSTEILRGRRYHNEVTVVMFDYRQRDQFTQEDLRRINKVVAEVLLDGIRTDLDIAFINDHVGLILPETGTDGGMILTQRLLQRCNRRIDARVVAGLATFPDDAITEDEIIERAKTALQVAINSDQLAVNFQDLNQEDETGESNIELSESENTAESTNNQQDYVAILENIDLDDDEWIVWIEGFEKMEDLALVEESFNQIDHVESIEFLFLQENHLVIKVRSSQKDLLDVTTPFPGWEVIKTSPENRYLLIGMEKEVQ
jgi:GGDEF domain-containing protein